MSDTTPQPRPPSPVRKTAVRAAQAGVNIIWLVPIIALIVTLAVAWNAYSGRGSLIEVEFTDATGINPGETTLRFREVTVGQVEKVHFTPDLDRVVVQIRVDGDLAKYIDDQATFWIVRPQVTAQGVTRLDTVLTGAFIEGYWDSTATTLQTHFKGLDRPPLIREGAEGSWIRLSMDSADGINNGAPILYHGVQVGRMENIRLSDNSSSVIVDAFIEAPHDKRLTSSTVFWDTSGFSLSLGTGGISFNVNSLASLLQGGVAFETFVSGGQPIQRGHIFPVQPDENTARNNLFIADQAGELNLDVLVDNSVHGLEKGADVKFQGLTVGRVSDLSVWVEDSGDGLGPQVLQRVSVEISPSRLGLAPDATPADALEFLRQAVDGGLRARVASTGFFGSSLMIEMVNIPDAPEAQIVEAEPFPIMPAVEGDISDLTQNAEGFLTRIGNLPIEELLKSATDMMNSVTALTSSPDTQAIPESLRKTMDEAQTALTDLREMVQGLRETGVDQNIGKLVDEATAAFQSVQQAATDVPGMVDQIDAAAARVGEVDFAGIGTQAEGILADLRAMLGSEDAEKLPRNLSDTLEAASGLLNDLRDGNAAGSLNSALQSASTAADEVSKSVQQLPQLIARLQATATRADAVLAAYGDRSAFNSEAINMLRELRRATESFGSLARMIERNPRAFILGR